jgi:hypothetical protein
MKKMMLLAVMLALAAMMLAAAPAMANDLNWDWPHHDEDKDKDKDKDHDDDDDDDDDDNGNEITSNDRFRFNNVGNFDFSPSFEASQETEQDCDSEEVSQSIDVTGGGENSIQTVGLQPTAVTGCAQNAVGILDADPIFAAQGGDLAFNFDENNVINDEENGDDDNNHNNNHNNKHDNNHDDNGDDNGDDGVDITDRDSFRFGGDRQIIHGAGGGDGFEVEDNTAEINASPSMVVNGGGTIEQAAAASSTQIWTPWGWHWV